MRILFLSPRIRHQNELTHGDWENAIQGLSKARTTNSGH